MTSTGHPLGVMTHRYVAERKARREISGTTARTARYRLALFVKVVGADRSVARIRRRQVEMALEEWGKSCSAATMRARLSTARAFFDWCLERGYVRANPCDGIPLPRPPRRLPRALPLDRVNRLVEHVTDRRDRLMILLALQEGLRVAEIAGLQLGDIDFGARTMTVVGKGDKERALPITDETWSALRAYLAECPAFGGPLIRSRAVGTRALRAETISRQLGTLMREAEAGGSAHALRHTMATDMLNAGANLRQVQVALGHATLKSTEVYLGRYSATELREAMGGRRYGGSHGTT